MMKRMSAIDQLRSINSSSFPHGKKSWTDDYHRALHKEAFPYDDSEEITTDRLAQILGGAGG